MGKQCEKTTTRSVANGNSDVIKSYRINRQAMTIVYKRQLTVEY